MLKFKGVQSILLISMLLAGCVEHEVLRDDMPHAHDKAALQAAKSFPQSKRSQPDPIELTDSNAEEGPSELNDDITIHGTGRFIKEAMGGDASASTIQNGDINLHFVDTDIAEVAKTVLGDLLKLDYVISPKVQGKITLDTTSPIRRADVLPSLQTALRLAGATAVEVRGVWRVVPVREAPFQGRQIKTQLTAGTRSSSFAVEIVQLHYISADEMQRLLVPVTPAESILQVDNARNLLVLAGSAEERSAMHEQISIFDVDWMAGMSFAYIRLHAAEAKIVADEVQEILGKTSGGINNLVRVVPVERMNALLLISAQPSYLERLKTWVRKLDRGPESQDGLRLYVYRVQNGRAVDLAKVLEKVFGKSSGSNGTSSVDSRNDSSGQSASRSANTISSATSSIGADAAGVMPTSDGSAGDYAENGMSSVQEENIPQITVDEVNNSILILATKSQFSNIESTLKNLDIRPLQVLIETSIAEVTLTDELQYGVQYYLQSGNFSALRTATSSLTPKVPVPGFALLYSAGKNEVILDLLESKTKVRLMSAPHMMVLNNQTATLQVGNQVPVQTQAATSVQTPDATIVSSIEYRNTGVLVSLTPRVNDSGLVLLDITQEVSDVSPTTTSGIDSPSFTQRKFTSSVAVQDGETVAMGGLISDSHVDSRTGLPLLSDIPYLGSIFSTTSETGGRTELLVLITPHVIRTQEDSLSLAHEIGEKMKMLNPIEKTIQ